MHYRAYAVVVKNRNFCGDKRDSRSTGTNSCRRAAGRASIQLVPRHAPGNKLEDLPVRNLDTQNLDCLDGYITMASFCRGRNIVDFIDDVYAIRDHPKNGVTDSIAGLFLVQEAVVFGIDKKLACRTIWHVGSSHGYRVFHVFQTVARFILDRRSCLLLFHVGSHTAALNHETIDDTMKNRPGIMAVLCVLKEVGDRDWGLRLIQG